MALITNQSQLNVGTELVIDEVNRTFQLVEAGNLVFKDGVNIGALYSKFVSLWNTASYQDSPFPMTAGNLKAGDFAFGTDGTEFNGWAPLDDATRNALRNGGWQEYDSSGALLREYSGFLGLGEINTGAQPYYILETGDVPTNFPFDDQFNVGIQTFGDAANGNFDKRANADTQAKAFVREQGQLFFDSVLSDTGSTIGPDLARFLIANRPDTNIIATDSDVTTISLYQGITVTYHATDQLRTIGGTDYPFRIIIEGNNGTNQEVYTKVQYLLRQDADIDSGPGFVNGRTADLLAEFGAAGLTTAQGVYIDNLNPSDANNVVFTDQNGVERTNPVTVPMNLSFTNNLTTGGAGTFRLMFEAPPGAGNDYGEAGAITVRDALGNPVEGNITSGSLGFTFDFDGDTLGGPAGTDKAVVLFGVNPGHAKPTPVRGTINGTTGLTLGLVAQSDPAYAA